MPGASIAVLHARAQWRKCKFLLEGREKEGGGLFQHTQLCSSGSCSCASTLVTGRPTVWYGGGYRGEEVIEGKKRKGSHHVKLGGRAIGELARVCI